MMETRHKDKTLTCLLAVLLGWAGVHRFYLHGLRDAKGWAYALASLVYIAIALVASQTEAIGALVIVLLPLPIFLAVIEALVHGLSEDQIWDKRHNRASGSITRSNSTLVVLLVLSFASGFVVLVAGMARVTDLLYTGGSFG